MSNDAPLPGSPAPTPPLESVPSLPARLWVILDGLRRAIAALGGRDRAAVPLVVLAWGRVGRLAQRFEALVARLVAGPLPAPRVRARRGAGRPVAAAEAPQAAEVRLQAAAVRLPRGFGWLVRMVPGAASYGCQLEAMLADPAMAALLAACPRAGRIIRPLKHMLGIVEPGSPVRATRVRATRMRTAWWQTVPEVGPAPAGPVPFPTGRPPPSWFR